VTEDLGKLQFRLERISRKYETEFGIEPGNDWVLFKLQEELGELTQAYLATTQRSRHRLEGAEGHAALARELADVLGFALVLAERLGIDAEAALTAKWLTYETSP
jgi:NTP pyrophosphatase (non-canonical NTP hydrolase)